MSDDSVPGRLLETHEDRSSESETVSGKGDSEVRKQTSRYPGVAELLSTYTILLPT